MKSYKLISAVVGSIFVPVILLTCGDKNTDSNNESDFELHEWGVLVGCASNNSYSLAARPEATPQVDLPVIYVHSKNKVPFTTRVTFSDGEVGATYPRADTNGNIAEWEDVHFATSLEQGQVGVVDDFVPPESIIETLNDVDADILELNGQKAKFLFYEGSTRFENKVVATYRIDSLLARVHNQQTYPIHDVLVTVRQLGLPYYDTRIYVAKIAKIDPNQTVTAPLLPGSCYTPDDLVLSLVSLGFPTKEASAFARLWHEPFYFPGNVSSVGTSVANLVYRLPQVEYDRLIQLTVTPKPAKTIRTLFVLTQLPAQMLPDTTNFEVREWGVMIGCKANPACFLTSRPEVSQMVRVPVIYVHSKDSISFSAKVTFQVGRPTATYPVTTINQNSIEWDIVHVSSCLPGWKPAAVKDYVPLPEIVPVLNEVDANLLNYNSQQARFLFYEGETQFANQISATYDLGSRVARFENRGSYPVYNVILSVGEPTSAMFTMDLYTAQIPRLDPGEQIDLSLQKNADINLADDLVSQGFSQQEAAAFAQLWKPTVFYPTNVGRWENLLYRIPQSEYDGLIDLKITPTPDKIIRTLYILVHLT